MILVVNSGSSSLKYRLVDLAAPGGGRRGLVERIGEPGGPPDHAAALRTAADALDLETVPLRAVGHRVVHGGTRFRAPVVVDDGVLAAIRELAPLAPLHNPANLTGIEVARALRPDVPQVAVFDTAFHADLPAGAHTFPGPREWLERGLRRFGFHGISHEYAAHRAARLLGRPLAALRLVTCHLGSGCSLAAVRNGRSVDTTMGFTPLDGLMMGTRPGTLDPGLILHLLREPGASVDTVEAQLNHHSGLRGLSGRSGDLREVLEARADGDAAAALAFEVYVHRLRSQIGGMLGALGGLDAIVFTAGVGENSPVVREAALAPFEFLGARLDPERNEHARPDADITAPDAAVRVLVIGAGEEWAIARAAAATARTQG